ncbi:bifunctional serine/threonine-protein kinase/formylglycine-generating enzyme family protein [Anatilimnocola floriformis]|uniref:bifunctional serine/threonine-protein kinase/formylglycine-generating enzyme family protein n=1 Tax=Anatilimnocola floriformis TaxID=2948575 RepID=UPI0020C22DED|nr:bifunctional serine/threonine-protein kinase/formylglycine-generating enzyme family protein [Anatilimnocola floriformis]
MLKSVEQFAKALVAAELLTADEVKAIWSSLRRERRPADGEAFACLLSEQQRLTKFQANEILSGSQTPLVLGDYVLLDKIGAGGMGQVFKARHRHMKRLAAIKLLPPAFTQDEAAVKRFQREVEAAAKLSHPHIVQAYDAGVQRGVWYLVMELVDGRDLASVVALEGPLPIATALDYVRQAALGLAFAHENGIVHRDVKPANLLLDKKGVVKVLDLGLARIDDNVAAQEGLTASGIVMGTIDFMAPEQAFDTHTADARADIYSLGCTLFRLLTNKNMYEGDTLAKKLLAHQQGALPSLASLRNDAPRDLVSLFEKLVAKEPAERPQTMGEVATVLASLSAQLRGVPLPAAGSAGSIELQQLPETGRQADLATLQKPQPFDTAPDALPPTVSLQNSTQSTDPVSERSIQIARALSSRKFGAQQLAWIRNHWTLAGGGMAALLAIALGISSWFLINRPAKIDVPPGGSATLQYTHGPAKPAAIAKGWEAWSTEAPKPAVVPLSAAEAKTLQAAWAAFLGAPPEWENSLGMKFVLIPPGAYRRGSTDAVIQHLVASGANDEHWRDCVRSEGPQHLVTLTQPFYLGAHEVTQANYQEIIGINPAHFSATGDGKDLVQDLDTSQFPVEHVSWNDAALFCASLSKREKMSEVYRQTGQTVSTQSGNGYRLPSEAEWEFACRAGTNTQFSTGDAEQKLLLAAWCYDNSEARTHPVGEKLANPFGVYDIHGNVWEWTQDCFELNTYAQFRDQPARDPRGPTSNAFSPRVVRGGCWLYGADVCRTAYRDSQDVPYRDSLFGFRVVVSVEAVRAAIAERQH